VELWTVAQTARHWGVTPSRARAILSSRGIRRVAGYPTSEVQAVTRRQGFRADLIDTHSALALDDTAAAIRDAADEETMLRYFFEFMRGADSAGAGALRLICNEPPLTGQPGFDALLGAAAEHIACYYGEPGPMWSVTIWGSPEKVDTVNLLPWRLSASARNR